MVRSSAHSRCSCHGNVHAAGKTGCQIASCGTNSSGYPSNSFEFLCHQSLKIFMLIEQFINTFAHFASVKRCFWCWTMQRNPPNPNMSLLDGSYLHNFEVVQFIARTERKILTNCLFSLERKRLKMCFFCLRYKCFTIRTDTTLINSMWHGIQHTWNYHCTTDDNMLHPALMHVTTRISWALCYHAKTESWNFEWFQMIAAGALSGLPLLAWLLEVHPKLTSQKNRFELGWSPLHGSVSELLLWPWEYTIHSSGSLISHVALDIYLRARSLWVSANFSGTARASEFILMYTTRFVLCHVHNYMTDMQMHTTANAEMTFTPPWY